MGQLPHLHQGRRPPRPGRSLACGNASAHDECMATGLMRAAPAGGAHERPRPADRNNAVKVQISSEALPGARPLLRPRPRAVRRGRRGLQQGPRRRTVPPGKRARGAPGRVPTVRSARSRSSRRAEMAADDRFTEDSASSAQAAPRRHPQRDHHRPGVRLGDRLLPPRAGVGRRPLPDPGRPAAALPDRAHRAGSAAGGCRCATRTSRRSPTTPSTSRRGRSS